VSNVELEVALDEIEDVAEDVIDVIEEVVILGDVVEEGDELTIEDDEGNEFELVDGEEDGEDSELELAVGEVDGDVDGDVVGDGDVDGDVEGDGDDGNEARLRISSGDNVRLYTLKSEMEPEYKLPLLMFNAPFHPMRRVDNAGEGRITAPMSVRSFDITPSINEERRNVEGAYESEMWCQVLSHAGRYE
jgi:hypothetical protein